jgi:putative endonuclease
MWFVYILECSDYTHYTGCTSDLEDRLRRHFKGENTYTKYRLPVKLVGYTAFPDKYKAYEFEKYLKSGSGKVFARKRLINDSGIPAGHTKQIRHLQHQKL